MGPRPLLIATGNSHKFGEIAAFLDGVPWRLMSLRDFAPCDAPEEDGETFVDNAIIKARAYGERFNVACVADDSGLEVDALGGAPGVYSARYAGLPSNDAANNAKLLQALQDVPEAQRTARFFCCIVYLRHALDPAPLIAQAAWEGRILTAAQGTNGFGYDPLFFVPTHGCTSAELDPAEKNRISHRGQALHQLHALLQGDSA